MWRGVSLAWVAVGVLAAQGGDGGGAAAGPAHAGLLEAGADDGFAAGFDDAGADEHAEFSVVGVSQPAGQDGLSLLVQRGRGGGAVGLGGTLDPLGGQRESGQLGEQAACLGERHRRPGPIDHGPQPRRQR